MLNIFRMVPSRCAHIFGISLGDHGRLVSLFAVVLQGYHLLRDLSLEEIEDAHRHLVLVAGLLFFRSAIFVEVQNARKNSLANGVDVFLSLLGLDVERDFECILNRRSLSQKQV